MKSLTAGEQFSMSISLSCQPIMIKRVDPFYLAFLNEENMEQSSEQIHDEHEALLSNKPWLHYTTANLGLFATTNWTFFDWPNYLTSFCRVFILKHDFNIKQIRDEILVLPLFS